MRKQSLGSRFVQVTWKLGKGRRREIYHKHLSFEMLQSGTLNGDSRCCTIVITGFVSIENEQKSCKATLGRERQLIEASSTCPFRCLFVAGSNWNELELEQEVGMSRICEPPPLIANPRTRDESDPGEPRPFFGDFATGEFPHRETSGVRRGIVATWQAVGVAPRIK